MLKIGNFSKLSRISIRMLRHYDDIGLLKPEAVDKFSGYRYYNESQLMMAGRIHTLKNMGFSLSMIGEIMGKYANSKELEHFLTIQKKEMEEQNLLIKQRIQLIDSTIEWLRKDGNMMGYDVSIKTMPEMYVASVRQVIPSYENEGMLWKILMEETTPLHIQYANPCYARAIFHDKEYKEQDVDIEVQMSVVGNYQDTLNVKFKTVKAVEIASTTFKGSYEQMGQVNEAVARWIEDNGYVFDGLCFNIYHVSPNETQNPDEYVTEVCYSVIKK